MNKNRRNRPSRSSSTTNKNWDKSTGGYYGSRNKKKNRENSFRKYNSGNKKNHGSNRSGGGKRKTPTFDPSRFINTNPVEEIKEVYIPKHKFGTFGLSEKLVRRIKVIGLETPTPIQDQIIPEILNNKDVIGLAETGTGKTAAFLIPIIEKTLHNENKKILILTPTRELAIQIEEELKKLSKEFRIFSVVCVGGVNIGPQIKALKRKSNFIIGTPGRVQDLINRKYLHLEKVTTVVLDEADRMLDMGFIHDIRKILSLIPKNRETLFFSATMSVGTKKIVHDFLKNPITVSVKKKDITNNIAQDVVKYKQSDKFNTLMKLLSKSEFRKTLIFGSMKHSVEKLSKQITENNIKAESIHGNKSHGQRQTALDKFKKGKTSVLVATDVAARGIHIENVSHVINYDLPSTFEDYVHRIGRTGRAEKKGKALTFVPIN